MWAAFTHDKKFGVQTRFEPLNLAWTQNQTCGLVWPIHLNLGLNFGQVWKSSGSNYGSPIPEEWKGRYSHTDERVNLCDNLCLRHIRFQSPPCVAFLLILSYSPWLYCRDLPWHRVVFTDEDYTPSIPTSTSSCHVPGSFLIRIKDLDDESDDENPAYQMDNSDDELSDDAIDNDENLQTNTATVSQPLSTPAVSHQSHHPLALPSIEPNSVTSTVCAPSSALLALGPIPPRKFYASTTWPKQKSITIPSLNPIQAQLDSLSQAYSHLSQQITELHSENSTLKAHCDIAGTEIQDLNWWLNVKENRPHKWRKLNVNARWLNSDEGLRLAEEQEALQMAEEQKKCELGTVTHHYHTTTASFW